MKSALFDCSSGVAGDMFLAAAVDAGADLNRVNHFLASVFGEKVCVTVNRGSSGSLRALRVEIKDETEEKLRHYPDIRKLIMNASLPPRIENRSLSILRRLAEAEACVHGIEVEAVHFHEIGAVDTIVDIVGAVICMVDLGIEKGAVSEIAVGSGTVSCAHGELPLPAPATAELLKGMPVVRKGIRAECTTPTGAAILKEFADNLRAASPLCIQSVGYGAGMRENPDGTPNVFRILIGEAISEPPDDHCVVEANIDDMSPEQLAYAESLLLKTCAQDVWTVPVGMKKSRTGVLLSVLIERKDLSDCIDLVCRETTTFGLRYYGVDKVELERSFRVVQTAYGPVTAKEAIRNGSVVTSSPEYEDCRKIAETRKIPLKEVYTAFYRQAGPNGSDPEE